MVIAELLTVSKPAASELLRMGKLALKPFALTLALATTEPGLLTVRLSWYESVPPEVRLPPVSTVPSCAPAGAAYVGRAIKAVNATTTAPTRFRRYVADISLSSISLLRQWTCQWHHATSQPSPLQPFMKLTPNELGLW